MDSKILLVGSEGNRRWVNALRKVTDKIEKSLEIINQSELENVMSWSEYALILIDANLQLNLSETIRQIHSYSPDSRIIVISSTPGWKEAKDVLLAGATDYERKTLVEDNILASFRRNLARSPCKQIDEKRKISEIYG